MTRVKKITVSNLKAISELTVDLNGCTAIITGGNNKGKSSFLRSLPDRIRGIKPDIIVKTGESEGHAEWEMTTGEKFIWSFDTKTKAGERLSFITKDNIKTSVTKEIAARYFPPIFDVDTFLASPPKKQKEILQKIVGIDFASLDARHKSAYDDRTFYNKKEADAKTSFSLINPIPEKTERVELSDLVAKKEKIKNELSQKYLANKASNDQLRKDYNADKERAAQEFQDASRDMNEKNDRISEAQLYLQSLQSIGYSGKEVGDWIATLPEVKEVKKREVVEPEYIKELPDDAELVAVDKEINDASETNRKADQYENYLKQKEAVNKASKDAEIADAKVKSIEKERMDLIKSAKMPEGFDFTDDGISYKGLPFTREQLSSSGIYIAALKLANMTLGEVKTLHFDASFLDKNSLSDIEKWANENDLQLLIERPDFEGGEIEYTLIS